MRRFTRQSECPCFAVVSSAPVTVCLGIFFSNERSPRIKLTEAIFFPPGATQLIVGVYFTALYRALASSRTRLVDHTQRRATVGRTPLNE